MRFFILILIAFVLALVSFNGCRNTKKQMVEKNDNVKTIVVPKVIDAKSADVIYDLDYIILEAKENTYFGHVSKLRVYKDKIYVLDKRYAKSLLVYTIEGEHIATIGDKKGHGPHEFINIANFEIDYANNQILAIDDYGYKFMIYDLDGNFIKRIDSKLPIFDAVLLPNGYILHAKPSWDIKMPVTGDYQIIITDENKQVVRKGFEYNDNKNLRIHIYDIISAQLDGGVNFAPKFRDTIYTVSFESIVPKYAIDFGNNKKIPKSIIDGLSSEHDLFALINAGNTCFMGNHVESEDFLYLVLGLFENSIYVFYHKQTNSTIAISSKAKITECEDELYNISCSDGEGYFYGAFNFVDIDELTRLFPELQKIDDAENLNPILFRYKVKI